MNSSRPSDSTLDAARQQQFLDVIDRDTAERRFHEHLRLEPLGVEHVGLSEAGDRVLAEDVIAEVDVPAFDRSNVDGFAVQAADTFEAREEAPRRLRLSDDVLSPGRAADTEVAAGSATTIATGAVVPRGADAVVMVEYTRLDEQAGELLVERPAAPGQSITFAGTDIARGETVLRQRTRLTSREIGVLAAIGLDPVPVFRRPRVAILSTGDEIIPPGQPLPTGCVYDSNAAILASAVEELGGEPVVLGCVRDDEEQLHEALMRALAHDIVLLSGGTSKGAGDISYHVVRRLPAPGIVAHGIALKPGKPICLAVSGTTPVVILPGFPTSAIFTFHEFVAPVIRALAGRATRQQASITARLPMRINSDRGRTEYVLVGLVDTDDGPAAYPMGKGSGSVTTFSSADGFLVIPQHTEILEADSVVDVQLLGSRVVPADLVVIGSHCVGLDWILGELQSRGVLVKAMHVGSGGGLAAAGRGECDLAGIHLLDPETGEYNRPLLSDDLELIEGYRRMQGLLFRPGDERFEGRGVEEAIAAVIDDPDCRMVNRNAGSGTRQLIDGLLGDRRPAGHAAQARSHNAVAGAVEQGRADWGLAIAPVARAYGLGFLPVTPEHYDFVVPRNRLDRPAIVQFRELLAEPATGQKLRELGFERGGD